MKLPLVAAVAFLLVFPAISRADMVIIQNVEGAGQSGPMTIKIKGDKTRADVSPQMSSITDTATGDSVMLMHFSKNYMKLSAQKTKALMEKMKQMRPAADAAKKEEESFTAPKATGKKQRIGEYDTEEYLSQIGSTNFHFWVAKDFPNGAALQQQMSKYQEKGLSQVLKGKSVSLKDLPGIAVKTEIEFSGQKISYTLVSIKEEDVNPKEFDIPAGYQEMAMPSFGEQ